MRKQLFIFIILIFLSGLISLIQYKEVKAEGYWDCPYFHTAGDCIGPGCQYWCCYKSCSGTQCIENKSEGVSYDLGAARAACSSTCSNDTDCQTQCSRCSNTYPCQRAYWTNPRGVSCDTVTQPVTYSLDSSCTNLCSAGQICQGSECVTPTTKYTCSSTGCVQSNTGSYTTSNCGGKCIKCCVGTSCQYTDNTCNKTCSNNSECTGTVSCSRCSNNYPCKKATWTNPAGVSCDTVTNPVTYTTDNSCGGCPLDTYTGKCQCNGSYLEKEVAHYTCNNGSCSSGTEWLADTNCGSDSCDAWSANYCKNGDVYHKRTCYDKGCSSTSPTSCSCYSTPSTEEALVLSCQGKGCEAVNGVAQCKDSHTACLTPEGGGLYQCQSLPGSGTNECTLGNSSACNHCIESTCAIGAPTGNQKGCSSSSDCASEKKYKCDANGNCIEASDGTYTTLNCDNKCSPPTHLACDIDKNCVPTAGAGADLCTTDSCKEGYACNFNTYTCESTRYNGMSLSTCQQVCQPPCVVSKCVVPKRRGGEIICVQRDCASELSNPLGFAICGGGSLSIDCCGYGYDNDTLCSYGCIDGKCIELSSPPGWNSSYGSRPYNQSKSYCESYCKNNNSASLLLKANKTQVDIKEPVEFSSILSGGGPAFRDSSVLMSWYIEDPSTPNGICQYRTGGAIDFTGKMPKLEKCELQNKKDRRDKLLNEKSRNLFSLILEYFIPPVYAQLNITQFLQYQWLKPGVYKVYTEVPIDHINNVIRSNTVTITVGEVPPTTTDTTLPPLSGCQILDFKINDKDNTVQNPLIVWVKTPLTGYFSVNDKCVTCTVTNNNPNAVWGNPPNNVYDINYDVTGGYIKTDPPFRITTPTPSREYYSYILTCKGTGPENIDINTLSLQTVKAINLPWWREIIPNLGGFLRGMIRFK